MWRPSRCWVFALWLCVGCAGAAAVESDAGPRTDAGPRIDAGPTTKTSIDAIFVAGGPSHGPGEHEYLGAARLLSEVFEAHPEVRTTIVMNGWPADVAVFDRADVVVFLTDGNTLHPLQEAGRMDTLEPHVNRGVGLVSVHWSVHFTQDHERVLRWWGGYYQDGISVNPTWEADFIEVATHETSRGIAPFSLRDEWYYNLVFADSSVVPILAAVPPEGTRTTPDAMAHRGRSETVAWAFERANGGRSFGTTGAHFHANWANEGFRRLVVNAIAWAGGLSVPANGYDITLDPPDVDRFLTP